MFYSLTNVSNLKMLNQFYYFWRAIAFPVELTIRIDYNLLPTVLLMIIVFYVFIPTAVIKCVICLVGDIKL